MIICNRCNLYTDLNNNIVSLGKSTKLTRKNYESLDESYDSYDTENLYMINPDYGSIYDSSDDKVIIMENKYGYINLCDECIIKMLEQKEAIPDHNTSIIYPFHTACCNTLHREDVDYKEFFKAVKINTSFPYNTYYEIIRWDHVNTWEFCDINYITDVNFSNNKCIICENCLSSYTKYKNLPIDSPLPIQFPLLSLKNIIKNYTHYKEYLSFQQVHDSIKEKYLDACYSYWSRKNKLLIKKELIRYIAERNLNIIRNKLFISKDIAFLILSFVK